MELNQHNLQTSVLLVYNQHIWRIFEDSVGDIQNENCCNVHVDGFWWAFITSGWKGCALHTAVCFLRNIVFIIYQYI